MEWWVLPTMACCAIRPVRAVHNCEPRRMFWRHERRAAEHHSGESNHRRRRCAIAGVYRNAIGLATAFINSPVGNNVTFQQPNPLDYREDLLRIDYKINDKHTVYGRYIKDRMNLIDPFGTFINTQLPTI